MTFIASSSILTSTITSTTTMTIPAVITICPMSGPLLPAQAATRRAAQASQIQSLLFKTPASPGTALRFTELGYVPQLLVSGSRPLEIEIA